MLALPLMPSPIARPFRPLTRHTGLAGLSASLLLLAGCSQDAPDPPASSTDIDVKTSGTFMCVPSPPGHAVQISSSADVPPGATVAISVQAPPDLPDWQTPGTMKLHCHVDEQWCGGTSCYSQPPVDFIGPHGDGLSWHSLRGQTASAQTTFTALAHNSDQKAPHHVTLTLDLPEPDRK